MRRALVPCLLVCGAIAVPAVAATRPPPRAALTGFVCQRATNHFDRAIEVVGVMRPVTGTRAMAMNFVLLSRQSSGGAYAPVAGTNLGRWLTPTPETLGQRTTDVWRLKKLVVNLPAHAVYTFRVSFRWTGSAGVFLRRTVRFSPTCAQ